MTGVSYLFFKKVKLMRDNVFVGTGRLMPDLKVVHGRKLTAGWVGVEVTSLNVKELDCWK